MRSFPFFCVQLPPFGGDNTIDVFEMLGEVTGRTEFQALADLLDRQFVVPQKIGRSFQTALHDKGAHRNTHFFPELSAEHRARIEKSNRVAGPGCYASGFASICYPLVSRGIMSPDYPVVCHAVSGYSGAGKKAIAQYEDPARNPELDSPRLYALTQEHKHLPEMMKVSGLNYKPIFNPYVCDYFQGMTVTVSLHARLLEKKLTAKEIAEVFKEHYDGCRFVKAADFMGEGILTESFIPANTLAGTNNMQIFVCGNDERIVITSRFDNLGKGASGAAVQCMNIMMGIDEGTGL